MDRAQGEDRWEQLSRQLRMLGGLYCLRRCEIWCRREANKARKKRRGRGGSFGREEQAEEHYNHSFIDLNLWLESNLIFIIANKKKEENTKRGSRRLIRISEMLRVLASTPG